MTPLIYTPVYTEFRPNDAVQLLDRLGNLPSGTAGRIVRWFARSVPTYLVSFEGKQRCVEVHAKQIALATAAPLRSERLGEDTDRRAVACVSLAARQPSPARERFRATD